jgi:hypothetical protein
MPGVCGSAPPFRGGKGAHGEELGIDIGLLGDDAQKGGENVGISRNPIDLV